MKKLIFPAAFLFVIAGLLVWPDRQEPVDPALVESPSTRSVALDSHEPRFNTSLRPDQEVELSLLDFDEVRDSLSGYTHEELIKQFNRESSGSEGFVEDMTSRHPIDRAVAIYDSRWKSFVDSLDLPASEHNQLRNILIAHDALNNELRDLGMTGQISGEEFVSARRSLEQLAESLETILSEDQIAQFWDHREKRSAQFKQQAAETNAQYLENGMVGILDAANRNDTATVRAYINSGADVNAITVDGRHTPLLDAARRGNAEIARMLLEAGADPNMTSSDEFQSTPLRIAAREGNVDIILALAAAGADLNFTSESLPSPLATAAQYGQTDAAATLLELGADATGKAGSRALTNAIRYGNPELEQLLIEAGAKGDILTAAEREFKAIGRRLGVVND